MPIIAHDANRGVFHHKCARCGHERRNLPVDPLHGHVAIGEQCLTLSACPECAKAGYMVVEHLRLDIPAWEAGEGVHPGSLVGTVFPDTGGIIVEHTEGYHLGNEHVEQARLIRAMQRHPAVHAHRPLKD